MNMNLERYKQGLLQTEVTLEPGLSKNEIQAIEKEYNFRFPPDLREFLAFMLPTGHSWINWRENNKEKINAAFDWPYHGMCFYIEHNDFWLPEWGTKPTDLVCCFETAKIMLLQAPTLIPVFSHRYIPERPHESGNPIFSVHQTDIIYYGSNLFDYIENEYLNVFQKDKYAIVGPTKEIEFWSALVE